jgi:hypothetical protein
LRPRHKPIPEKENQRHEIDRRRRLCFGHRLPQTELRDDGKLSNSFDVGWSQAGDRAAKLEAWKSAWTSSLACWSAVMFRILSACCIGLSVVLMTVSAQAEAPLKSGLQTGEHILAIFEPINITGEHAGEPHCLVCENGVNPVAMVFARGLSEPLESLIEQLDAAAAKHEAQEMGAFVVFLSDDAKLEEKLKAAAKKHKLKHVVLSTFDPVGPEGFEVSADADVTVVLYREFVVKANHALRKGELTEKRAGKILADVPKILAKE